MVLHIDSNAEKYFAFYDCHFSPPHRIEHDYAKYAKRSVDPVCLICLSVLQHRAQFIPTKLFMIMNIVNQLASIYVHTNRTKPFKIWNALKRAARR